MPEQTTTTTAPELTDEQALAKLEERVAAMEPGPFRTSWEEIVAIEKNRQRIRRIEEATRVKLPPDTNRWRILVSPPASPPAESSPERPSGWAKFDAIGPPPGVDICDRMMDAQDRRDKAALIEAERLAYRQQVIDAHWEDKLIEEQRRRKQAERSCHRGPGDPDFDG
jgi:hypothetical protein